MFQINEDNSIYITRGDVASFSVTAEDNGTPYIFQQGDIVRFNVYEKKNCDEVVIRKDFAVSENSERVDIFLSEDDTKVGRIISKPTEYWYEVVLNPVTNPQTIIGYDEDGAKIFKLYPEGNDTDEIEEEDIPVVDEDFSDTSERPLQNHVITKRFESVEGKLKENEYKLTSKDILLVARAEFNEMIEKGTYEENKVYLISDEENETDSEALKTANTALRVANETKAEVQTATENSQNALYVANEARNKANASAVTNTYAVSIPNSKWTEDAVNGGYSCSVGVNGILATDTPIADVVLGNDRDANKLYLVSWSNVTRIVTENDTITLYANDSVPITSFTMQLKVVR